jgi:hypothetical protein
MLTDKKTGASGSWRKCVAALVASLCLVSCGSEGASGGGVSGGAGPAPRTGMKIGTNFWDLGWGIWDDVFRSGVDFATATDPWNPAFLEEVRHYNVLRFMDFGRANSSTEQRWSERTHKTDVRPAQERLAYEWMIDLCNRASADLWITLPTQADDSYAFELAKLIATNLDPSLKVYVEWSNETWNSGFPQYQYAVDQGLALGLGPDPYAAGARYHVQRSLRLFAQFDAVFGAGSPRVVRVIAGQAVNTFLTGIHLAALADARINPTGLMVDAYAIAPYFGHDVDGGAANAVSLLGTSVAEAIAGVHAQHDLTAATGMRLIAYEGGQHITTNADVVNAKPEMYTLYTDYLDGIAPYLGTFSHYLHNGEWGSGGAWGAERFVAQPLDQAHKLRAIFNWIAAHR